jgi:hypothetical protein
MNGDGEFKYEYCEELNPHWPHDHGTFQNLENFGAVLLQGLGMFSMIFVALPTYLVDDQSHAVTEHPSDSIAKIAIVQAVLYFYMIFGNYPTLCTLTKRSILPKLLNWIPNWVPLIGNKLYNTNEENSEKDITFNILEGSSMELVGFMGLL